MANQLFGNFRTRLRGEGWRRVAGDGLFSKRLRRVPSRGRAGFAGNGSGLAHGGAGTSIIRGLGIGFFRAVLRSASANATLFCYRAKGKLMAWNLCFAQNGMLIDKYIGFAYPQAHQHNLYTVSWFHNLQYALAHGLRLGEVIDYCFLHKGRCPRGWRASPS